MWAVVIIVQYAYCRDGGFSDSGFPYSVFLQTMWTGPPFILHRNKDNGLKVDNLNSRITVDCLSPAPSGGGAGVGEASQTPRSGRHQHVERHARSSMSPLHGREATLSCRALGRRPLAPAFLGMPARAAPTKTPAPSPFASPRGAR